jgi:hypothetical protein
LGDSNVAIVYNRCTVVASQILHRLRLFRLIMGGGTTGMWFQTGDRNRCCRSSNSTLFLIESGPYLEVVWLVLTSNNIALFVRGYSQKGLALV